MKAPCIATVFSQEDVFLMLTETQQRAVTAVIFPHFIDRIIETLSLWHLGSGFTVSHERSGAAVGSYHLVGEAKTYTH